LVTASSWVGVLDGARSHQRGERFGDQVQLLLRGFLTPTARPADLQLGELDEAVEEGTVTAASARYSMRADQFARTRAGPYAGGWRRG